MRLINFFSVRGVFFGLKNINLYFFIFIFSIFSTLVSFCVALIYRLIEQELGVSPVYKSYMEVSPEYLDYAIYLFSSLIYAPLLETFIFHFALIVLLQKYVKKIWVIILLSSLGFSFWHYMNSPLSMISTFFTGLFLAYSFIFWYKKTGLKKVGFEAAMGVHVFHNLYSFLQMFIPASLIF